jgi:hypothetical protein
MSIAEIGGADESHRIETLSHDESAFQYEATSSSSFVGAMLGDLSGLQTMHALLVNGGADAEGSAATNSYKMPALAAIFTEVEDNDMIDMLISGIVGPLDMTGDVRLATAESSSFGILDSSLGGQHDPIIGFAFSPTTGDPASLMSIETT